MNEINRLVIATGNTHKTEEIRKLLGPYIQTIEDLKSYPEIGEIDEIGLNFEENATLKASAVGDFLGENSLVLSDDSGLEVVALSGEPGVYSARYAGQNCNPNDNIQKVLKKLIGRNDRTARFRTVIALIIDGKKSLFEGECEGEITKERKGENGFGYDPIFLPKGVNMTFAQMTKKQKGEISHRGRAIKKLVNFLQKN